MPLYSDSNYYYTSGSSSNYSPYYTPGLYNNASSAGGAYAPYSSTYNRSLSGTYVVPLTSPRSPTYTSSHHGLSPRYQPKLSTITETSPLISSSRHSSLMPLTRIQSPKISGFSTLTTSAPILTSKYIPPRPININTADIDVSSTRYQRHHHVEEVKPKKETPSPTSSVKNANESNEYKKNKTESKPDDCNKRNGTNSTIKRNRAVVRLSTIRSRSKERANDCSKKPQMRNTEVPNIEITPEPVEKKFKDLPTTENTNLSWRQKLAEDLAAIPVYPIRKSPGDLIRERYLIQEVASNNDKNNNANTDSQQKQQQRQQKLEQETALSNVTNEIPIEEVLLEIDPVDKSIRRLSIPNCPTFHDICEDISSDKIDDDLNAGELRRRASIIQEQEQELLNQLQKSGSGTFQFIHLERRDSQDSHLTDESTSQTTKSDKKRKSKKKSKKIRHRITAVVQIENAPTPLTPIQQEKDEEVTQSTNDGDNTTFGVSKTSPFKPKFSANVETIEEHHEIHKIFKLPKKKSVKKSQQNVKDDIWPEGFTKAPTPPKVKPLKQQQTQSKQQQEQQKQKQQKTFTSTAEIFTFNRELIENIKNIQMNELKAQFPIIEQLQQPMTAKLDVIKERETININNNKSIAKFPNKTSIQEVLSKKGIHKSTGVLSKTLEKQLDKSQSLIEEAPLTPPPKTPTGVATPKPIRKTLQKSDSGEDFWAQIGSRETLYMTNRKKAIIENQWMLRENLLESQTTESVKNLQEIKSVVTAQKTKTLKQAEDDYASDDKNATTRSRSNESSLNEKSTNEKTETKQQIEQLKSLETFKNENAKQKIIKKPTTTANVEKPKGPLRIKKIETQNPKTAVFTQVITAKKAQSSMAESNIATTTTTAAATTTTTTTTSTKIITANATLAVKSTATATTPSVAPSVVATTTETSTTTTKINVGQNAKSPEQQQDIINATKTTKMATTAISKFTETATTDKNKTSSKIATTDTIIKSISATTILPITTTPTTTTTNALVATTDVIKPKTDIETVNHQEMTEIEQNVDNTQLKLSKEITLKTDNQKQKLPATKPKVNISKTAAISNATNISTTIAKPKSAPINADQFIFAAPVKLANTSPNQLNKTKTTTAMQMQAMTTTAIATSTLPAVSATSTITTAAVGVSGDDATAAVIITEKQQNKTKVAAKTTITTTATTNAETTTIKTTFKTTEQLATPTKMNATIQSTTTTTAAAAATLLTSTTKTTATATTNNTKEKPTTTTKIALTEGTTSSSSSSLSSTTIALKSLSTAATTNAVTTFAAAAMTTMAATTTQTTTTKTKTTTTTTTTKTTTTTTTTTTNTADAATAAVSPNNDANNTHDANNLSKFATVSNLAQCLHNVDADLDDYIPSSAENSDDDNLSDDDSSFDYSSVNGCENLSESMKKKLKQRRKKEKQAEKARFDPQKKIKIDPTNKCYVKDEAPRYPLVATPRPLWKREKIVYTNTEDTDDSDSDESGSTEETEESEECTTSEEYEDDAGTQTGTSSGDLKDNSSIIRMSTCSNDSGFEGGTAPSSPKKMLETSYTYSQFQKSGRFTAPATVIPRFKNYTVDDFHFLAVLGKGSFGKVLLAELRDTTYYYAVKCLKKDVVLEDDDVDSTLIERKVLALGTKHPYLCHLFCTFQTESHLFFVMEYLNGGDLMFHIQESGRFAEERARFYGAEIISGLKFLHKKGIIYRDLKLDNVLLDYEGHVRIADFGMCKLQIYLDKTADSFCGTPDYMAPEIIKGEKYNQNVDWWSFGVLLYEMLIGQSPFSGCDEEELFWSICNEIPWFPVYISAEATHILKGLLEKDYAKRIGSQYSPAGEISEHIFFRPIDWNLLEKRQLPPPFKPQVKHPLDTQYFDRVFTRERVRLTPIDKDILQSMDQKQFLGFTYTNPHITLD